LGNVHNSYKGRYLGGEVFGDNKHIMGMISNNLQQLRAQIGQACTDCGRNPNEVTLLAVCKTFGPDAVRQAYAAGQRHFGENYIQEGEEKIASLQDLSDAIWHMVGPVQSNKTRVVAEHFAWMHSVDRLKTAQRLSAQRPVHLAPLQVCIQVNIDAGLNKSGVAPDQMLALAQEIHALPSLQLRGMMVIPEPAQDPVQAASVLQSAKDLFITLKQTHPQVDTLSMGMSADMTLAIAKGSTMVRVGTAIFGGRH
jgi:PLP dependent protein